MNKLDLLKLGHMIRRTSENVSMRKLAQAAWWKTLLPYAGALAGGAGGYMAHNKLTDGKGSGWGSLGSTLAGAGLGGAAGGARFPWTPQTLQKMYNFGGHGGIPLATGAAGALYGGYQGNQNADALGLGGTPTAATLMGAGLGGALGMTAGAGMGGALRNYATGQARGLAQDTYGKQLADMFRTNLEGVQGSGILPGRLRSLLGQDPQNFVGQSTVAQGMKNVSPDRIFKSLELGGGAGLKELQGGFAGNWMDPNAALRTGSGLGFNTGAMNSLREWLTQNAGPESWNYLRGGAALGGGYMGAHALADLYNKVKRPDPEEERRRRGGVIVL